MQGDKGVFRKIPKIRFLQNSFGRLRLFVGLRNTSGIFGSPENSRIWIPRIWLTKSWQYMILITCIILYASFTNDECRIILFKEPIQNKAMKGHVIRKEEVPNQGVCELKCYMEPNCVSINVGPMVGGKHKCELNNRWKPSCHYLSGLHLSGDWGKTFDFRVPRRVFNSVGR